ncbi:hypothetical protein PMAYCL1PPCAC_16279, partial [Pristionchus mayeri]
RNKHLGSYQYLMVFFCFFDIYYNLVHWLVYPMHGNGILVHGQGFVHSRFGVCLYATAYLPAVPILAFHFLYRTLAIRIFFVMYVVVAPDDESVRAFDPI